MEKKNVPDNSPDISQVDKYADDLTKIYKSEKEKRKELEASHLQLEKFADDLVKSVLELQSTNQELQEAYLDTIHRLVLAAEYKDEETGDHIVRMSRYSALIAEKMDLPDKEIKSILAAAPMHDIGKIGIADNILLKPAKLTKQEFEIMKIHTGIGAKILANAKAEILRKGQRIAISHHEKWNGKGYPVGNVGEKIPLEGRITGLADVFDALTSKRPYKDPYPVEVAVDIIRKERGEHFAPDIVDVFLENINKIIKIKTEVDSIGNVSLADFAWSERDRAAYVQD